MADNAEKEEKTEEASPRRIDEARDKGQVGLSSELFARLKDARKRSSKRKNPRGDNKPGK